MDITAVEHAGAGLLERIPSDLIIALVCLTVTVIAKLVVDHFRLDPNVILIRSVGRRILIKSGIDVSKEELNRKISETLGKMRQ